MCYYIYTVYCVKRYKYSIYREYQSESLYLYIATVAHSLISVGRSGSSVGWMPSLSETMQAMCLVSRMPAKVESSSNIQMITDRSCLKICGTKSLCIKESYIGTQYHGSQSVDM